MSVQVTLIVVSVPAAGAAATFPGAGRPLYTGGGGPVVPVSDTLSNVPAVTTPLLWLHTPSPMKTLAAIEMVALPTAVQVVPLVERSAVNVVPLRVRRTQYGAVNPATDVFVGCAPVVVPRMNSMPAPGVSSSMACVEGPLNVSRIITPALANWFVFWIETTRAVIDPLPVSGV